MILYLAAGYAILKVIDRGQSCITLSKQQSTA